MEYYDYIQKQLDNLGLVYSPENDRIIAEIKIVLHRIFADYNQMEAMRLYNAQQISNVYKPQIDALLVLLSLPEIQLSEETIKQVVEDTKAEKETEIPIGELGL